MPQRAPPKVYHLLLKTHRLTIFLTALPASTIAKLKEEALSALTSTVLLSSASAPRIPTAPGEDDIVMDEGEGATQTPSVQSTDDFELCRAVRDRGKLSSASSGSASATYETLDPSTPIKGLLNNWETLFVQFRDETGSLVPVEVSQPSLLDDEDEDARRAPPMLESPVAANKGKRKAPPE